MKNLMQERRLAKGDLEKYQQIHNTITQKCRTAKEQWLEQEYQEMERLKNQNSKEMFQRIQEITSKISVCPSTCIKSATGKVVLYELEDIAEWWSEYPGQLFKDVRTVKEITQLENPSGPSIAKDEVRWALQNMKLSPDEVVTEMLKALGETGINILHNLVNKIYDSGELPDDMLKSIFIHCQRNHIRWTVINIQQLALWVTPLNCCSKSYLNDAIPRLDQR